MNSVLRRDVCAVVLPRHRSRATVQVTTCEHGLSPAVFCLLLLRIERANAFEPEQALPLESVRDTSRQRGEHVSACVPVISAAPVEAQPR
jgi:hypothetical protein